MVPVEERAKPRSSLLGTRELRRGVLKRHAAVSKDVHADAYRSMGGLLIADAARDIAKNTREGEPMWPKIVALLAFDTPVSSAVAVPGSGA